VYSTRIAYVVKSGNRFELKVDDADGQNPRTALRSTEPIISPAWSPDGTRLAYVSFQAKKPVIYVHSLATGAQTVVANFKGSNSAPPGRPDGKKLAVVLTKDGSSQIYTINPDGSGLTRIAGFEHDRHRTAVLARRPVHLLHVGPRRQPADLPCAGHRRQCRARHLRRQLQRVAAAVAGRQDAGLCVAQQRSLPDHRDGPDQPPDPDPDRLVARRVALFAPNGRVILYASEVGGRGVLSAVSSRRSREAAIVRCRPAATSANLPGVRS
jgi:TolB protein